MTPPLAPDRAARAAVTVAFVANGLTIASFVSRIPDVQHHLGIGARTLGLVLASLSVGVMAGIVTSGRLVGAMGSRRVSLMGGAIGVLALPVVTATPFVPVAVVALAVLGAGSAVLDVGMNAQGVGVERTYRRSIMVGFHAAWSIGALVGAVGGSIATAQRLDVVIHLTSVALVVAGLLFAAARWLRIEDRDAGDASPAFALPRGALLPLALVALAAGFGENAAADWSGIHLRDGVGVAPERVAWGYVAFTAGMVTVRLVGDALTRLLGRGRMITGGAWVAGAGFLLVAAVPSLPAALVGFAVIGLGVGSTVPLAFAAAGNVAATPGQGVAAVATVAYLAFVVAPPLVGAVAEASSVAVAFGGIGLVIIALSTRRLPTDRRLD